MAKTIERVEEAKRLRSSGLSYQKIADQLGICKKSAMKWVDENYNKRCTASARNWESRNPERVSQYKAEYNRSYYKENSEAIKCQVMEYYHSNKESIIPRKVKYTRERRRNDPMFRLACNLRCRLYQAIKRNYKAGSAVRDLGCSIEQLKKHLESLFQEGMSWENYGDWHVDHIKPLASFDLSNRDEFLQANHFTNLQPLWAKDNIEKGAQWQTTS